MMNTTLQEEERAPLLVRKIDGVDLATRLHFHQNYEISYVVRGGKQYLIGDHVYEMKDHDLFLIDRNMPHTASSLEGTPMLRYSIKFRKELVAPMEPFENILSVFSLPGHKLNVPDQERLPFSELLEEMVAAYSSDRISRNIPKLYELLFRIKDMSHHQLTLPNGSIEKKNIRNVLGFIQDHLHHPLTLDKLSDVASMSKYHFARLFKREVGTTVYQYVLSLRISHAIKLLEQNQPLQEIAIATGFGTYSNFIAAFRKMKGLPPLRYKKEIMAAETTSLH